MVRIIGKMLLSSDDIEFLLARIEWNGCVFKRMVLHLILQFNSFIKKKCSRYLKKKWCYLGSKHVWFDTVGPSSLGFVKNQLYNNNTLAIPELKRTIFVNDKIEPQLCQYVILRKGWTAVLKILVNADADYGIYKNGVLRNKTNC